MDETAEIICALSSAQGRAGIAVVRLSGAGSAELARRIFVPRTPGVSQWPARMAMLGYVTEGPAVAELDEAVLTYFPAPRSYTGEDVVEISLHGSPVVVACVLDRLCGCGARLAQPGEFTLRAVLNGRIDLAQAEAIHDVIHATTLYQARVASRQRAGDLSRRLAPLKETLVGAVVALETALEFGEEDVSPDSREQLSARLGEASDMLRRWVDSYRRGHLVRDGFGMAVVGRPNVGKSSLFNALLFQERSIVTEIPGTTRDLVSEFTSIGGIPVRLVDTAGLRESADVIERLGVDRSMQAIADADAILLVVDAGEPASPEDLRLKDRLADLSCIVVMNKSDLPGAWKREDISSYAGRWPSVAVSAATGAGLDELREEIMSHLMGGPDMSGDGILVTNLRHCRCLESAGARLEKAMQALRDGLSEEFVSYDLRAALQELGAITGETTTADLLEEIFSRFCIGK